MLKQVIVMRNDLNIRKGKTGGQIGHGVLGFMVEHARRTVETIASFGEQIPPEVCVIIRREELEWLAGTHDKIVCKVDSEAELLAIHEQAKAANLPVYLVQDLGKTEFTEPTYTCVSIGPCEDTLVDPITRHLKLL